MSFNDKVQIPQVQAATPSTAEELKDIPFSDDKSVLQRVKLYPRTITAADTLTLQKTIGNRAVCQFLKDAGLANDNPAQQPTSPEDVKGRQGKNDTVQKVQEDDNSRSQPKENKTGLPDDLKAGVENLSGMSMDKVRVHYNSDKPAELGALAYTKGTDIHVAPGQEKHLPHETWHVVQQTQGRVRPILQMQALDIGINDDAGLEREADEMGATAFQAKTSAKKNMSNIGINYFAVQRKLEFDGNSLVKSGRFPFAGDIIRALNVKSDEDRCHSISYDTICQGIMNPINDFWMGKKTSTSVRDDLFSLISSLFPENGKSSKLAGKYYNLATTNASDIDKNLFPKKNVVEPANGLVKALNNSPENLRPGKKHFNRAIGKHFDGKWEETILSKGETIIGPGNKRIIIHNKTKVAILKDRNQISQVRRAIGINLTVRMRNGKGLSSDSPNELDTSIFLFKNHNNELEKMDTE